MRSYSSLLCHILGSHREIDGYCETHIKYRTYFDLFRLKRRVVRLTGEPLRGRYVLDKVLHDYPLASSILRSSSTRAIVLLRRPKATVRSIINMGRRYSDIEWYRDVDAVTRYYETRLESLSRLADRMGGRVMLLEAETLLTDTTTALDAIATFLKLREPLQVSYRRFAHTGEPGYGDPSKSIGKGRIAVADTSAGGEDIEVPETNLRRLESMYLQRTAALRERCALAGGAN